MKIFKRIRHSNPGKRALRDKRGRRDRRLLFENLDQRALLAFDVELAGDINSVRDNNVQSTPFEVVGNRAFYEAYSPTTNRELWVTDGTAAGTKMVKDIRPGIASSFVSQLTNVNGTLFFVANDGTNGYQLWKSDGTDAGTVMVRPNSSWDTAPELSSLINLNGTLLFSARDSNGSELWKSDGTQAGTVMVKDIVSGAASSNPSNFTRVNNTLFFQAAADQLWKSDGTATGTVRVKDAFTGFPPSSLTNVNGTLYFKAAVGNRSSSFCGIELWKSDGTTNGTVLVKDIRPGISDSNPSDLINVNGTLYFRANDGTNGPALWKSNGTAAGTVMVKDIRPGTTSSLSPSRLTNVNGTLFFTEDDTVNGQELWKSDGTALGTVMVKDIFPGASPSSVDQLINLNGILFFRANDGSNGVELWRSDGTSEGTVMVKDLHTGPGSSGLENLTNFNGALLFAANDGTSGHQLFQSDGTNSGTVLIKESVGTSASNPTSLVNVNGTLFFLADDGTRGIELWKTDGTAAGTRLVKDIRPGAASSQIQSMTNINGTLFFSANDGTAGQELWKSDGTEAGTVMIRDIGAQSSDPIYITNVNGIAYFSATQGNGLRRELWKSDGTTAGTVKTSYPVDWNAPTNLTNVDGTLYFVSRVERGNPRLAQLNGTTVTTVRSFVDSKYPNDLTNVNGVLYFQAYENGIGSLWKSNGTSVGTTIVSNVIATNLTNIEGTLYFRNQNSLWKSDGTPNGTLMLKEWTVPWNPVGPFVSVKGSLYFTAPDGTNGQELWKSDGTPSGTALVKDLLPGTEGSRPELFTNVNGTLYFQASNGVNPILWSSDGTPDGTYPLSSMSTGDGFLNPLSLQSIGNTLYYSSVSDLHGAELWKLTDLETQPDITLTRSTIPENAPINTAVGSLGTTDPNSANTYSYSFVTGFGDTDNNAFSINGNTLRANITFDYETKASYSVRIRATRQNGIFVDRVFTISITDVNEPPTLTCSQASVSGNVLSTLTNTGTWFDPEGRILSMSASLGGVSWTSNGTWTWTFVPTQRYTAQTVTITATDEDFSTQISFEITTFNAVVNRGVFYKGSGFSPAPSRTLAESGTASQTLTFANLTNTTRGINGLVFYIAGSILTLTSSDIRFRMSPTGSFNEAANPPSSWVPAPNPTRIIGTLTTENSVRVEWADNAIANRWLQITIFPTANTGLMTKHVYYIGHLIGETNGLVEGGAFMVRGTDTASIISRIDNDTRVTVDNVYDINKDGRIRGSDSAAAVAAIGRTLTRITIPPAGSSEEGEGTSDRFIMGAPSIEKPELASAVTTRTPNKISARLTDAVFTAPQVRDPDPIVAHATSASERTQNEEASTSGSNDPFLSLDEYFKRLGNDRAQGVRARRL